MTLYSNYNFLKDFIYIIQLSLHLRICLSVWLSEVWRFLYQSLFKKYINKSPGKVTPVLLVKTTKCFCIQSCFFFFWPSWRGKIILRIVLYVGLTSRDLQVSNNKKNADSKASMGIRTMRWCGNTGCLVAYCAF